MHLYVSRGLSWIYMRKILRLRVIKKPHTFCLAQLRSSAKTPSTLSNTSLSCPTLGRGDGAAWPSEYTATTISHHLQYKIFGLSATPSPSSTPIGARIGQPRNQRTCWFWLVPRRTAMGGVTASLSHWFPRLTVRSSRAVTTSRGIPSQVAPDSYLRQVGPYHKNPSKTCNSDQHLISKIRTTGAPNFSRMRVN